MRTLLLAVLASVALTTPAAAEITARSENAFSLSFERAVPASADAVLNAVAMPAAWWNPEHSYSGEASNIRLDLRPGGCWCEDLPGGGVKHGETVLAWPEQRMVRFDAPFGPLQGIGADALLTMTWADPAEGQARALKWTFVVNGPGVGAMADVIDRVLAEQFNRLAAHLGG